MIHSLQLGNRLFPNNIIQGPLAGVSCAPFRHLAWRYSQPAFSCTEMISCKTLLYATPDIIHRYTQKHTNEGPVCFQLASNNATELADATKKVTDMGADIIDLNCGCPVKKIRSKGAGSKLLTDPARLYQLIRALKQNTHVPVTVKIRVQGESSEQFNLELANMLNDAGPDGVIVHGRHWTEHYETPCRYTDIEFFVNELKMPVIGNGDIRCQTSLLKMLNTGCQGVMVSRSTVGQPWLIGNLISEWQGKQINLPTAREIAAIFIEHIQQLARILNSEKQAVFHARKLAKYYGRQLKDKLAFVESVQKCEDLSIFIHLCHAYFV